MRIGNFQSIYFFLFFFFFLRGMNHAEVQTDQTVNYGANSNLRWTKLWNAIRPQRLIDAIILPEATLDAATASVSYYY